MISEEQQRKMKQKYLREQIIGESLDKDQFALFLREQKDNGDDIDEWDFDELITTVEDYKKVIRNQKIKKNQDKNNAQMRRLTNINNIRTDFNTLSVNKDDFLSNSLLNKDINLDNEEQKFQEESDDDEKQQIEEESEVKSFGPKIIIVVLGKVHNKKNLFQIKHFPEEKLIHRSFQDISWLRQSLQIEFPFYYIPPVQGKDFKEKFLQNFFSRLSDMQIARDSEALKMFLNDSQMSNIKNKTIGNVNSAIQKKIYQIYQNKQKRISFQKNEKIYDKFLGDYINEYNDKKQQKQYFEKTFKKLDDFFIKNQKVFSQLKHLSYGLADLLSKVSKQVCKISNLYSQHLQEQRIIFQKVGIKQDEKVQETYNKLNIGLDEWGSSLLTQKKFILDNLASYYHYQKHENKTFHELINCKLQMSLRVEKKIDSLYKKKQKLFNTKDISKWGIKQEDQQKFDINNIFQDFNKVKQYIIPEESKPILRERDMNSYINTHTMFEFMNYYIKSQFYLSENFKEFSTKMQKQFAKEDLLWNKFNQQFKSSIMESNNQSMSQYQNQ